MELTALIVKRPQTPSVGIAAATDTEFLIPTDNKTMYAVVINAGTGAAVVTFKKGDGIQAVNDLVMEVPAGERKAVYLDPGSFQINKGADANHIAAESSTAVEIIAVAV